MTRFWVSWVEKSEDYRPTTWPLPASVPAYWCSGYSANDSAILCAVIDAPSEDAARKVISDMGWTATEWRFFEEQPKDWRPEPSRFPWRES